MTFLSDYCRSDSMSGIIDPFTQGAVPVAEKQLYRREFLGLSATSIGVLISSLYDDQVSGLPESFIYF